jgi:hypothetical protein
MFDGDFRSLIIVGSVIVHLDDGHFIDVLYVPNISFNLILVYQIAHSSEAKTIEISLYQVVFKDLKYVKDVVETRIIDDITRLYKFYNFRSLYFL